MFRTLFVIGFITISTIAVVVLSHHDDLFNMKLEVLKQRYSIRASPVVHHEKLEALGRPFETPQEVTQACNSCHTERAKEVINSSHWNWERVSYVEGRGIVTAGKKNVLNNFCIGAKTNEQACAKCHIGFGMKGDSFDFENTLNVDCMVCHDNSDTYQKGASMSGYPDREVNLTAVAKSVGRPTKENCGACHFYSGGGNNVKHGDLEHALLSCDRETDVHMASNGMNMLCVDCHGAPNHIMRGKLYSVSSENINRATCEECHTATPHHDELLNRHFAKVSCQACHIPVYAKENATKMSWRWSDAGKLKNGKPYKEDDAEGNHTYLSQKGSFTWAKNVIPDYIWFNGTADHYILGDKVERFPVKLNALRGSYDDSDSRIIPVKIHRGDQIYDPNTGVLVQPKLFSNDEGDPAFWKSFNWDKAARAGMERIGLPYSGEHKFVETEMFWPINHMVSPKGDAVDCSDCHTRKNGRLAKLDGFYLPGRDKNPWIDGLGTILVGLAFLGVAVHAGARSVAYRRKRRTFPKV
jgi:octaheme c-type cytochrome (tetrathionate reductase family)